MAVPKVGGTARKTEGHFSSWAGLGSSCHIRLCLWQSAIVWRFVTSNPHPHITHNPQGKGVR